MAFIIKKTKDVFRRKLRQETRTVPKQLMRTELLQKKEDRR